ncbi:translocation/assembly module TamB domain-containing protein [Hoeflea sp. TYP-13]|uniref:translocation/assembly module TamB domain-containing protein n=1 Tax=Hoeflea sp. TYP-13 TaxID=3230023 RepID=UPI0034C67F49
MKSLLRILLSLFLLALCIVLLVFALLGTGPGLSMTASIIGSVASSKDRTVEIADLEGVLSGTPKISRLSVADTSGIWLTADNIEADISIGRLLAGEIDLGRLSVDKLAVERRPQAASQSDQSGGPALPSIPIKIDNVFLRDLQLAEPVLGEKATLQLTGSVLLRNEPVDLSGVLEIVRIDGTSGEVSAEWTISPDSNELALQLAASEPADGLLARALDIYGFPAIDVNLSGSGPLDAWKAELAVELDGRKTVEGNVSLSLTDERQAVDGVLKGYLAPLLPRRVTPLFAGDTQIELSMERDGQGTVRVDKLSARSALLSVVAGGNILADAGTVDLNADVTFGTDGSEVTFSIDDNTTLNIGYTRLKTALKGSLDKADWTLSGSVKSLSDGTIAVSDATVSGQSSNVDFLNRSGQATIELAAASLSSGQGELDRLLDGNVRVTADASFQQSAIELNQVELKTDAVDAKASGQVDIADRTFALRAESQVEAPDQGIVADVLGSRTARVSGAFTRDDAGTLSFADIQVESSNLTASGSGQLADGSVELNSQLSLSDLSVLREGLAGGLNMNVGLTGPLNAPNFEVQADGADISVLDKPLEAFSVSASGAASPSDPRANVELQGRYEGQPVSIKASVAGGPNGAPVVDSLDLTVPGARANGQLTADTSGILTGKLDVDVSSLVELGPLLLQEGLSGSLSGSVVFADKNGKQSVEAKFDAPQIETGPVEAKTLSLTVTVDDLSDVQAFAASATAQAVTVSGTTVADAKASVSGGAQLLPFSVSGRLFDAPMALQGEVSSQHGTTTIELSKASATVRSIPVELSNPVSLTLAQSATHVETATLRVGAGTVVVKGTATDELAFDVNISAFPVSLFEKVAATGLGQSGTLSGTAKISGTPSDPNVSYNLKVTDFSVEATRGARMPALSVQSNGSFASGTLTTQTKATGSGIDFGVNGTVAVQDGQRLNLKVDGKAPLELASFAMANSGVLLEGTAQISMTVTGSAGKPQINGRLTTSGADFVDTNTSLTIREINASISFNGTSAKIDQLQGRLGRNGTVSAAGSVSLNTASGLPANLTLTVKDGTYISEIVTAQLNADLKVDGALLNSGKISGTISLERTDINIPDQLPASIPFVDVIHKNAPRRVVEQARELDPPADRSSGDSSGSGSGGLQLDIAVKAPARIFLRGRGIDSEFGGSIDIYGTTRDPRIRGSFSMIRGRIDILTKRFNFDRGTITFTGTLDPALSFQTTTTNSGTSYSIVVGGTASDPEISFTSSPQLPEDEILANLFFGKNLSKLSAIQVAQLANALTSLGGAGQSGGVLGRLRSAAGLADIDINTDDADGGTSIGIGRYLNDRTYLNVEQGLSGGSGRVTIDLDLTDNLKARGEADTDGNSKAGVFFERDY